MQYSQFQKLLMSVLMSVDSLIQKLSTVPVCGIQTGRSGRSAPRFFIFGRTDCRHRLMKAEASGADQVIKVQGTSA